MDTYTFTFPVNCQIIFVSPHTYCHIHKYERTTYSAAIHTHMLRDWSLNHREVRDSFCVSYSAAGWRLYYISLLVEMKSHCNDKNTRQF